MNSWHTCEGRRKELRVKPVSERVFKLRIEFAEIENTIV
jgi:hypothetical protein